MRRLMFLLLVLGLSERVWSQTTGAATAASPTATSSTPAPSDSSTQGFTYDHAGRRDPFVSLIGRGQAEDETPPVPATRPPGLAGLTTNEISLRGTMQSRDGFVGLVQGADTKTYIVKPGGKLLDGTIRAISADAMVILQAVEDPLSKEKEREVRKSLRQQMRETK